ncbi:hypothetical protein AB6V29_01350 [Microbacterium sp. 20-116]|uniref:hypothetical protein n=1 Tax=Microbacterium sp. 20-116 TaxID=3239883 RepID=UPI0034E231F9
MNSPLDYLIAIFEQGGPFLLSLAAFIISAVGVLALTGPIRSLIRAKTAEIEARRPGSGDKP